MAKQTGKAINCETCEGRPPKLLESNVQFMHVWDLVSNSFNYASTMETVFPTCLNWSNVEVLLRMFHIKPARPLIKRIRLAETLTIKRATDTLKKKE